MVKVTIVLVLFALVAIYSAQALKCYHCDDCETIGNNKSEDCEKSTTSTTRASTTTTKKTPKGSYSDTKTTTAKPDTFYCSTIKYKSIDKDADKDTEKVKRSCVTFSNACMAPPNTIIEECKTCKDDDCNGTGAGSIIHGWAFTALIIVAMMKLFI